MFKFKSINHEDREWRLVRMFLAPLSEFMLLIIALFTTLWGIWVVNPYWNVFDRGNQYRLLDDLAAESMWGGVAIIIGGILIAAVWSGKDETLRLASLVHFYLWCAIATSYILSDFRHLAVIQASFFATTAAYAYINLSVNRNHEKNLPYNNKADII